jgi:NitT/TauT family transport system substrate-binding protein
MELIRLGFPAKIVLKADRNGNGFVLSDKIKSITDLNTSKAIFAVPHIYSQHHVLLYLLLEQNNIRPEKVTIIDIPPRDMINSLRRGEIDGFMVGEPEANKSVSLGVGWMAATSPQIWKDHMDHVFIATNRFINEQSVQLQELINVLVRGGQFIEANPHEAAIMGEDYTGSSAEVFEQVLTSPPEWIDFSDMVPTINDIKAMSANMVKMKLWKDIPPDPGIFIDPGFVKQAMKNLSDIK